MNEDGHTVAARGDAESQPMHPNGQALVERVLQIEEEIAATHQTRASVLVKVGIPAGVVVAGFLAAIILLPLAPAEKITLATLAALIGVPSAGIGLLLARGRSDRSRLREELHTLLSSRPGTPLPLTQERERNPVPVAPDLEKTTGPCRRCQDKRFRKVN